MSELEVKEEKYQQLKVELEKRQDEIKDIERRESEIREKTSTISESEEKLKSQGASIEASKAKLFRHWENYVHKNEKLKGLERSSLADRKLLEERER